MAAALFSQAHCQVISGRSLPSQRLRPSVDLRSEDAWLKRQTPVLKTKSAFLAVGPVAVCESVLLATIKHFVIEFSGRWRSNDWED